MYIIYGIANNGTVSFLAQNESKILSLQNYGNLFYFVISSLHPSQTMSVNHSKSLLYTNLQHCFSVFLILSSAYSGEYPHSCALVVSVRVHFTPQKTKDSTLFNQLDKILHMCFHGSCSHLLS